MPLPSLVPLAMIVAGAANAAPALKVDTPEAARSICKATEPLARARVPLLEQDGWRERKKRVMGAVYEASVPLGQFDLAALDEPEREITFARRDVLRPAAGVQLFMAEADITLQLDPASLKEGSRPVARIAGELLRDEAATFRVRYELADGDGAGPCPTLLKTGSRPLLMIEPLDWELVDGQGRSVARGNGEALADRRSPPGGRPQVAIAPATVDGDGPPASQVTEKARLVGNALHACYEASLTADARAEGSLVVRVEIDGSGVSGVLDVTADTVNDPKLAECTTAALKRVDWGRGGPGVAIVPVLFERK